jgi:hypothetical protein
MASIVSAITRQVQTIRPALSTSRRTGDRTPLARTVSLSATAISPHRWDGDCAGRALRFVSAMGIGAVAQAALVTAIRRHVGTAALTAADHLTLLRAAVATGLIALAASGLPDRSGSLRWVGVGATVTAIIADWFDGPLARRVGPTRLGAVLDIEADSLLTLGLAICAVRMGRLPLVSLLPPVARYADPIIAFRRGETFTGDGPWWCRVTGGAQMIVLLAAISPWSPPRDGRLHRLALPVALVQLASQVVAARLRAQSRAAGYRTAHDPS